MTYTHSEFRFKLADGRDVYWNRVNGFSVEHDHQYLVSPTKKEALEIEQITSDDDAAHSETCESDKVASSQQTEMW